MRHALVHKTKNVYFFKMYKWYALWFWTSLSKKSLHHLLYFVQVLCFFVSLPVFLQHFCIWMLPNQISFFAIQVENFCKFLQKNCNWTFTFQYKCKIIASSYFQKYTKISQHLAKQLWFVTKRLKLKLKIFNNFQKFCILNLQIFCDLVQNFLIIKEDSWSHTTILKVPIIQLIVPVAFWHDCCFCVVSFQMLQSFLRFPGFFHAYFSKLNT